MDHTIIPISSGQGSENASEIARFRAVFLRVAPAMFLGTLDQTIVAAALPAIAASLSGFSEIAWVVTSYMLAATVAAPIYGRLGDALGRKHALLWALTLFVVGSAVCSLAPSMTFLIAGRGLQGLGGGGLMTLALALLGETVSPKERGRFQGWFGAIFAFASATGPFAGGYLSEHLGWRSVFWINLPLGVFGGVIALSLTARPGGGKFALDVPGTLIFVGATVALLLAMTFGPTTGWDAPLVFILAVLAVAGGVLLLRVERRASDPLISLSLLFDPVVWRTAVCVLLFAALFFGALVQLPLFLQLALHVPPGLSGLLIVPLTLAQVVVSTATGYHISSTGRPKIPMALGLSISAGGFLLTAAILSFGPWAICVSSMIFGLGLGTTMPAAQTLAQWAAGSERLGAATAIVSFTRSIGGVFGTALTSAILLGAIEILAPGLSGQIAASQTAGSMDTSLSTSAIQSIDAAFRYVFIGLGILGIVAALIAWSTPDVDLSRPPKSGQDR